MGIRRVYAEYRQLPQERRLLIRKTVLVLLFFVVLGIVASGIYHIRGGAYSTGELNNTLRVFME